MYLGPCEVLDCDSCMRMNAQKAPFARGARERSTIRGERIHSDLKEVRQRSKNGCKYAICFVDDATRRGVVYGLKHKSDAKDAWARFLEEELAANGLRCRYFRCDNGGEYQAELRAFNNARGIQAEFSPPHCQSINGVAEVFWRDTFRMVRTILWDQQRDDSWWLTALTFASHYRNHLSTTALDGRIPEAAWRGCPVDVSHFRVPLSKCWSFVEKENRDGTLDARRM